MRYYKYISSPLGDIELCATTTELCSVLFVNTSKRVLIKEEEKDIPFLNEVEKQFNAYFNKKTNAFDIPILLEGTEFQKKVWTQLLQIPYGEKLTYLQLAKKLGNEMCIRAAASANGKNPLSIIIPCHRVIGSNNALVGYSGNLQRKEFLLKHEGALVDLFS